MFSSKAISSTTLRVGLVTSHFLAARYLCDLLVSRNVDRNPVLLPDPSSGTALFSLNSNVVVLVDLRGLPVPVSTYLDAMKDGARRCSYIALDTSKKPSDVARLLLSGFAGYLNYDEIPDLLEPAISAVASGQIWATSEVMHLYVKLTSHRTMLYERGEEMLTRRENEILELLKKRYSNKEIATFFGISESTVKFHVSNILAKMNLNGRKDVTADLVDAFYYRQAFRRCS
jgi:two-component system, NarL family, nitrate/nitrite response regulator NarL